MIKHRPCGACRALVPADSGCDHWKPKTQAAHQARREASRKPAGPPPEVKEFQRVMRGERA